MLCGFGVGVSIVAAYIPARLRLTNAIGYVLVPAYALTLSGWLVETFGHIAWLGFSGAVLWGIWDSRRVVKRWREGSDPPVTGWYPLYGKPSPGVKGGKRSDWRGPS